MTETEQATHTAQQDFIEAVDAFAAVWNKRQLTVPPRLSSLANPAVAWSHDPQLVVQLYDLMTDAMGKTLAYLDVLALEEIVDCPNQTARPQRGYGTAPPNYQQPPSRCGESRAGGVHE